MISKRTLRRLYRNKPRWQERKLAPADSFRKFVAANQKPLLALFGDEAKFTTTAEALLA